MRPPDAALLVRRLRSSPLLHRLAREAAPATLYLTGGGLRDRLLGVPTRDVDLAVEGEVAEVAQRLAARLGGTLVRLGSPPNAAWRLVGPRWHLDLVEIGPAGLRQDITRRDFTVNAIFWRLPAGPLLDLTGGLDDLAAGRLAVIHPNNLFDDPVRVLRGLRLVATRPGLSLTADAERHLAAASPGLRQVAAERISAELELLLTGPAVRRALRTAWRLGVLAPLHHSWQRDSFRQEVVDLADRLAALAGRAGRLASGARLAALAILGAPAAGFPTGWDEAAATAGVHACGVPLRRARQAARAGGLGEALAPLLGGPLPECRERLIEEPQLASAALAWAVARRGSGRQAAMALLRWLARFTQRPPLLRGEEVRTLLALPAGPGLAQVLRALRRAQARGEVRTSAQARRWLSAR